MLNKIRNNFITGLAIIFPVALTVVIIRYLIIIVNSYILEPLVAFMRIHPYLSAHSVIIAKFLVFFIVILLISLIGWAASIIFLRKFFGFGEKLFIKIPMIGKMYAVTKEIGSAFLGHGKAFFKSVVLIEYPRKDIYTIAFITGDTQERIAKAAGKEMFNVFVATSPNPTSGYYLLVPKRDVKFLDITVEEGLKLVISSGAIVSQLGRD
ncbi:MAG: DUF502 domain-containing protein [Candidatus Omnitrophota bacterium]